MNVRKTTQECLLKGGKTVSLLLLFCGIFKFDFPYSNIWWCFEYSNKIPCPSYFCTSEKLNFFEYIFTKNVQNYDIGQIFSLSHLKFISYEIYECISCRSLSDTKARMEDEQITMLRKNLTDSEDQARYVFFVCFRLHHILAVIHSKQLSRITIYW